MDRRRRRRHVVLSVDELVPLPIVRKVDEVVVGELRRGRLHVVPTIHRGIRSIVWRRSAVSADANLVPGPELRLRDDLRRL